MKKLLCRMVGDGKRSAAERLSCPTLYKRTFKHPPRLKNRVADLLGKWLFTCVFSCFLHRGRSKIDLQFKKGLETLASRKDGPQEASRRLSRKPIFAHHGDCEMIQKRFDKTWYPFKSTGPQYNVNVQGQTFYDHTVVSPFKILQA